MSDQDNQTQPTELDILKQRARLMGISFSNNIGVDALAQKINEKLSSEPVLDEDNDGDVIVEDEDEDEGHGITASASTSAPTGPPPVGSSEAAGSLAPSVPQLPDTSKRMTKAQRDQAIRVQLHRECMRLIRCRITNLNPMKKDLPGEIFVVDNKYLGTVKKFVPYGEATDEGYHIPKIIYDELVARKFQQIKVKKDKRTQTNSVTTRMVREFAIEVLPQLSKDELSQLAKAQIAAGSVDRSEDNSL